VQRLAKQIHGLWGGNAEVMGLNHFGHTLGSFKVFALICLTLPTSQLYKFVNLFIWGSYETPY